MFKFEEIRNCMQRKAEANKKELYKVQETQSGFIEEFNQLKEGIEEMNHQFKCEIENSTGLLGNKIENQVEEKDTEKIAAESNKQT